MPLLYEPPASDPVSGLELDRDVAGRAGRLLGAVEVQGEAAAGRRGSRRDRRAWRCRASPRSPGPLWRGLSAARPYRRSPTGRARGRPASRSGRARRTPRRRGWAAACSTGRCVLSRSSIWGRVERCFRRGETSRETMRLRFAMGVPPGCEDLDAAGPRATDGGPSLSPDRGLSINLDVQRRSHSLRMTPSVPHDALQGGRGCRRGRGPGRRKRSISIKSARFCTNGRRISSRAGVRASHGPADRDDGRYGPHFPGCHDLGSGTAAHPHLGRPAAHRDQASNRPGAVTPATDHPGDRAGRSQRDRFKTSLASNRNPDSPPRSCGLLRRFRNRLPGQFAHRMMMRHP